MGSSAALLVFLVSIGLDVTPMVFLIGLAALTFFLVQKTSPAAGNIGAITLGQEISFEDIGGQSVAKQELKEALDLVVQGEKSLELGIRPLRGLLLAGPPGTGKTLLAKAAASYTDAVFLTASGSEFIEMYAGVGARRVRNIFEQGHKLARSRGKNRAIIFIDEIEVLGGKRGSHTGHLEYDQTLNQLLVEMDGIKNRRGFHMLVIGATNRPDMLDPALLRPGRFDRVVTVEMPGKEARLQILKIHTTSKPLAPNVNLKALAEESFGFCGAQLESLANEAAILALREGKDSIEQDHLESALEKVILGEKLERRPTDRELYRIAVHESGHALISEQLRPGSVAMVTLHSRSNALGYMRQNPREDTYLYTGTHLRDQVKICLAGAVTEKLVFGSHSTGALGDIQEAIKLGKQIIGAGLSDLGFVSREDLAKSETSSAIKRILAEAEHELESVLSRQRQELDKAVSELIKKESLSGNDFQLLMRTG